MIKTEKFQNNTENCTLSRALAELDRHRQKSVSFSGKTNRSQQLVAIWWDFQDNYFLLVQKIPQTIFWESCQDKFSGKRRQLFLDQATTFKKGFFLKKNYPSKICFLKRPQSGPKNDQVVKNICEARHIPLKRGVQLIGGFQESLVQNFW